MARPSVNLLVSILNWNNTAATNKCLEGIAKITKNKQPDVIVVDNHSTIDKLVIPHKIKRSLNSLKIINNTRNVGFAGGHNPIIKMAWENNYDYICLLNNDSEIIDAEIFEKMIKALDKEPRALAANPTILSSIKPALIWYGGGHLSLTTSYATHLRVGENAVNVPKDIQPVSFLTGNCLMISLHRARLESLRLNEEYFVYWEDADWCAKAIRNGFMLLYVPDAKLLHRVSSSLGVRSPVYIYYNIRNHLIFVRNNISPIFRPLAWVMVGKISIKYLISISLKYNRDRFRTLGALYWGWSDGIRRRSGALTRNL